MKYRITKRKRKKRKSLSVEKLKKYKVVRWTQTISQTPRLYLSINLQEYGISVWGCLCKEWNIELLREERKKWKSLSVEKLENTKGLGSHRHFSNPPDYSIFVHKFTRIWNICLRVPLQRMKYRITKRRKKEMEIIVCWKTGNTKG